jgi:ABC-type transporter Mla subunit MlaD
MVTITGNITANNLQINENTDGNVSMKVGIDAEDFSRLLDDIQRLIKEFDVSDPAIEAIIEEGRSNDVPKERVLSKLQTYLSSAKDLIATGEQVAQLGDKALPFIDALSKLF